MLSPKLVAVLVIAQGTGSVLHVGDRVTAELGVGFDGAPSEFHLAVAHGDPVVFTVESIDFDAAISVEEIGGPGKWESGKGGVYTDAELEIAAPPAELVVHVRSEDSRSGSFQLSVNPGPRGPRMPRDEWLRRTSEHCERGAARAFERSDPRTGLRLLSEAWQYAHEVGDIERERRVAEQHSERARAVNERGEELRAQAHLGMTERRGGSVALAQQLLSDAVNGLREWIAKDSDAAHSRQWMLLVCAVHYELGGIATDADDLDGAQEQYRRQIELAAKAEDVRLEALGQSALAGVLDESGDAEHALAAANRAVVLGEQLSQPYVLAQAHAAHGRIEARRGSMHAAEVELERALESSPPPELRCAILGTLAEVFIELARYEAAICALDELQSLVSGHRLSHHVSATRLLSGRIAIGLGEFARARKLLDEAAAVARDEGRPRDEVRALLNLGMLSLRRGDYEASEAQLQQALELSESIGERSLAMRALLDLGELEDTRGRFEKAMQRLHAARDVVDQLGNPKYSAVVRGALAFVMCRSGDAAGARDLARGSAQTLEQLSEWESAADARETLVRIALQLHDPRAMREEIEDGERLLAKRETGQLDGFERASVRSRSWTFGALAQDVVSLELAAAESDADRVRTIDSGFEASNRWKGHVLFEEIRSDHPSMECPQGRPTVPEGQVWIEFSDGLERLYAYAVTPAGISFHDLGVRDAIERDVRAFVDAIAEDRIDGARYAEWAASLYERLLTPVLSGFEHPPRTIVVFPTPALSVLPFDALVAPASERSWDRQGFDSLRCVVDDTVVVQLPSASVLSLIASRPRTNRPDRVLVVGDPVYYPEVRNSAPDNALALRVGEDLIDYSRLKGTRDEAFAIADLMLERNPRTTDADRAALQAGRRQRDFDYSTAQLELCLGSAASLARFGDKLAQYTKLHVAVHGCVNSDDPRRSGLVLSYEPQRAGLWTLADVLDSRLTADLVVLSACDTASGPIIRGEGIQSVAHAFLAAGARSVLASLWRVNDTDTARLMKEFYARMLENADTPASALREAKLAVRKSESRGVPTGAKPSTSGGTHPHAWAPFIFVGAP